MKPELTWLLFAVVLTFGHVLVATIGAQLQVGLATLAANREKMVEFKGWAGRAQRAHRNMLENMLLFVPLVLIAVVAGKTNATTLMGAQIFVLARLVYALVYFAGVPWLRTGVWLVSVVGLVMIALQLL